MKTFRIPRLAVAVLAASTALFASQVGAQNLVELYDSARGFDASYQSARAQNDANIYRAEQSRALLLPSAGLSVGASRSTYDNNNPVINRDYNTGSASITATQPLYRPANWVTFEQGKRSLEQSEAALNSAEQDLIIRVSQAYFDVLAAQDTLMFVRAQKSAVAEQLAAAKRNFEVGTSTITDSREAQARYDLVIAQEIAADNDLRVKSLALDTLVGRPNTQPAALATPVLLPPMSTDDVNTWVRNSEENNPVIRQNRVAVDIAQLETEKAKAGHKPTIDLNASYGINRNAGGSTTSPVTYRTNSGSIGVVLNVPLFAGFATQNRIRETLSLEEKARDDLEASKRVVAQTVRAAYFGVSSGHGQVRALQAAEASSQSALEANQLGYQVGVRINIDVLNAQSQLFQTKRDLAQARYNVLLGNLRLRQAAGLLRPDDLQATNALLAR